MLKPIKVLSLDNNIGNTILYGCLLSLCLLLFSSAGQSETLSYSEHQGYSLSDINAGYIIGKALVQAYPQLIEGPIWEEDQKQNEGDWVFYVRGKKFFWVSGRLLDAKAKAEPNYLDKYSPYRFYDYPDHLPAQPGTRYGFRSSLSFSDEQPWQGLRNLSSSRGVRNMEFFHSLLDVWKRTDMKRNVIEISFLGCSSKVHHLLVPALKRINQNLHQARKKDKKLDRFLNDLRSASSYVWRNVAGTQTLSSHSYGIAIDLIPKRWRGDPYWLWVKRKGLDWQNYPYEKRWQVPDVVVKAFEQEGFIWGGKWYRFDTMHFEYHPELRLLKPYFRSLFGIEGG